MKLLFICYGNICRSPMAEFIMKDIVKNAGLLNKFEIASASTSTEEIGNPVYPPARKKLNEHKITCGGKTARQMTNDDYNKYDYIIAMEERNIRDIKRNICDDPENKMFRLLDFTNDKRDISDPWYTNDFDTAWNDIFKGCEGLFKYLCEGKKYEA